MNVRRRGFLIGVVGAVLGCAAAVTFAADEHKASAPIGREQAATRKIKLLHVRIDGDLDSARFVRDFAEVLGEPRGEGFEMVVLEVSSRRWRTDVLAQLVTVCAAAKVGPARGEPESEGERVRLVAWLNGDDVRMGTASAALAIVSHVAYAAPRVEVIHEPGDEVRGLAPAETDWAGHEQTVRAAVWSRLSARGSDVLLAAAIPSPQQALWLTPHDSDESGQRMKVVDREPAAGTTGATRLTTAVTSLGEAVFRLKLSAEALMQLGVVQGQARELGQILAAERVTARQTVRREVRSGLASARKRLVAEFAGVDDARNRIDQVLDEAERARGHDAPRKRRKAGESGATMSDEALRRLVACETLTEEYPELLREMPPGQTSVGVAEQRVSWVWSQAFQSRREELAELRARADRLKP